jgi:two-component system, NtrC family, nitrogen regulation sensor histidine kinase NtrY
VTAGFQGHIKAGLEKAGRRLKAARDGAAQAVGFVKGAAGGTAAGRYIGKVSAFWLSLCVVFAALLSSVATFLILNNLTSIFPTNAVVLSALGVNAAFVLAIMGIIGFQVVKLLKARKRQAGAGLHFRIVTAFCTAALFPAVLLAVSATVSIDRIFDAFFSTRVKSIVSNSVEVAQSYMQESGQTIRSDVVGVGREVEEKAVLFQEDKAAFDRFFSAAVSLRAVPAAFIVNSKGELLSAASEGLAFRAPQSVDIARASSGRIVTVGWDANGVAALKKLLGFEDAYLYALRPVNPNVLRLLQRTQINIMQFTQLEQMRGQYQFVFAIMYVLLALTLLTSAIWYGLVTANRLVMPIRRLIGAAQEVSQGNLNVHLDDGFARDDIGRLGATFKQMTVDLKTQRDELMDANALLDERRRFIEAVLSGVTAGVIGVNPAGCVTLINRSAIELLRLKEEKLVGKPLKSSVPEFAEIIEKSKRQSRSKRVQAQITLVRESGERNFAVQVTREEEDAADFGVVVTFDDVTELTVAQRTSAWADVARRIAHEIKNPLTPIQLSAERLRRKYAGAITTDREIFDKCTDTIIRHVGDIGRMVDEFSSFARMPSAVFEEQDIREVVREAVILFQMSRPEIEYKIDMLKEPLIALCDRRLLTQAVTNLVKNASEAIDAHHNATQGAEKGRVVIRLRALDNRFNIEVIDNGVGLPKTDRHRLVEPYVTTRQKGTGLGLAIVQRITEQHGGVLELADAPAADGYQHGAWISMSIPVSLSSDKAETDEAKLKGKARTNAPGQAATHGKEGLSHGV